MGNKAVLDTVKFSEAIKKHRQEYGLKIETAAYETGISISVFHRIEQGGIPKLKDYVTIVWWMKDYSLDDFFSKAKVPSSIQ